MLPRDDTCKTAHVAHEGAHPARVLSRKRDPDSDGLTPRIRTGVDGIDPGAEGFTGKRLERHRGPLPGVHAGDLAERDVGDENKRPEVDDGHQLRVFGDELTLCRTPRRNDAVRRRPDVKIVLCGEREIHRVPRLQAFRIRPRRAEERIRARDRGARLPRLYDRQQISPMHGRPFKHFHGQESPCNRRDDLFLPERVCAPRDRHDSLHISPDDGSGLHDDDRVHCGCRVLVFVARAVTARATGKSDAHEGCQEQMRVKILHVPSQRAFMRSILASQARISCRVWSSAMRASVSDCCAESTSIDREAPAANFDFVSR